MAVNVFPLIIDGRSHHDWEVAARVLPGQSSRRFEPRGAAISGAERDTKVHRPFVPGGTRGSNRPFARCDRHHDAAFQTNTRRGTLRHVPGSCDSVQAGRGTPPRPTPFPPRSRSRGAAKVWSLRFRRSMRRRFAMPWTTAPLRSWSQLSSKARSPVVCGQRSNGRAPKGSDPLPDLKPPADHGGVSGSPGVSGSIQRVARGSRNPPRRS